VPPPVQGAGLAEEVDEQWNAPFDAAGSRTPDSVAPWGQPNSLPAGAGRPAAAWELSASRLVRLPPLEDSSPTWNAAFPSPARSLAMPRILDQPDSHRETRGLESMD
jgi:hypothetical protein